MTSGRTRPGWRSHDLNGDKTPDLVVGNAFGDVLVLVGEGNGLFDTPVVDRPERRPGGRLLQEQRQPDIRPRRPGAATEIVVDKGKQAQPIVLADRTTGLLVPGTPVLADLSGNGLPDLIVPNTGGNSVLVYPGLPEEGLVRL